MTKASYVQAVLKGIKVFTDSFSQAGSSTHTDGPSGERMPAARSCNQAPQQEYMPAGLASDPGGASGGSMPAAPKPCNSQPQQECSQAGLHSGGGTDIPGSGNSSSGMASSAGNLEDGVSSRWEPHVQMSTDCGVF